MILSYFENRRETLASNNHVYHEYLLSKLPFIRRIVIGLMKVSMRSMRNMIIPVQMADHSFQNVILLIHC